MFLAFCLLYSKTASADSYTIAHGRATAKIETGHYAGREVILSLRASSRWAISQAEQEEVRAHLERRAALALSAISNIPGCSKINKASLYEEEMRVLQQNFQRQMRLRVSCGVTGMRSPP